MQKLRLPLAAPLLRPAAAAAAAEQGPFWVLGAGTREEVAEYRRGHTSGNAKIVSMGLQKAMQGSSPETVVPTDAAA